MTSFVFLMLMICFEMIEQMFIKEDCEVFEYKKEVGRREGSNSVNFAWKNLLPPASGRKSLLSLSFPLVKDGLRSLHVHLVYK